MQLRKIWNSFINIGIKYEPDYVSRQNIRLLNQYTLVVFFVLITYLLENFFFIHHYFSYYVLLGFSFFLLLTITVLVKYRRIKFLICVVLMLIVFLIFFYESYCDGIGSGIYLYYFSLIFALPFIFNFKTDWLYIGAIFLFIIAAILVNVVTNYSLFATNYYKNAYEQKYILYLSMFDNFVVSAFNVIFIIKKIEIINQLYSQKQLADLELKNTKQTVRIKDLEALNTKQKLLISNLRITQKIELLEKAKDMDIQQLKKMIRKERVIDKNFDNDVKQLNLNVSPEFYQALNAKAAPNKLTSLDIKYCTYIYTRMSNKEISSVLGIGYASVKQHRHRLKSKLHLNAGEDLDFFIRNITLPPPQIVK